MAIDWKKFALDIGAIVRDVAEEQRRKAAVRRFRRAMRRHEKRARALGLPKLALTFEVIRAGQRPHDEGWMRRQAARVRAVTRTHKHAGRVAFLYERAADAVAQLREAVSP